MTSAISASSPYLQALAASSSATDVGLRVQLARDRKELSACINCASAETLEGKKKISEISGRIAQAESRIGQAQEAKAQGIVSTDRQSLPKGRIDLYV